MTANSPTDRRCRPASLDYVSGVGDRERQIDGGGSRRLGPIRPENDPDEGGSRSRVEEALALIYQGRCRPRLIRVARDQGLDRDEAEDVLQVVALKAAEAAAGPEPIGNWPGWLRAVTRNTASKARRGRRHVRLGDVQAELIGREPDPSTLEEAEARRREAQRRDAERLEALGPALARLNGRQAYAFRALREGLTVAEIAGALGLSRPAARKLCRRMAGRLRKLLAAAVPV